MILTSNTFSFGRGNVWQVECMIFFHKHFIYRKKIPLEKTIFQFYTLSHWHRNRNEYLTELRHRKGKKYENIETGENKSFVEKLMETINQMVYILLKHSLVNIKLQFKWHLRRLYAQAEWLTLNTMTASVASSSYQIPNRYSPPRATDGRREKMKNWRMNLFYSDVKKENPR